MLYNYVKEVFMSKKFEWVDENGELTEAGKIKMDKLNKYAAKQRIINSAEVYETDKEVAESIKNIGKDLER